MHLLPRSGPELLSFVIPINDEEEVLPLLREQLERLASQLQCRVEWLLINDGSRDGTESILEAWAREDPRAKVVHLSRNFGQQAAQSAGMDHAAGDAVVLMDADLQDTPELVHEMLACFREGYDVAVAQRTRREGESFMKRASAAGFYRLMRIVQPDLPVNAGDFRLMSRRVVDAVRSLREHHRFLRGLVTWVGFEQTTVPFARPPRAAGHTGYTWAKMLRLAWDAALAFTTLPLRIVTWLGGAVLVSGLVFACYTFIRAVFFRDLVRGWATIVILQCVIGGAILFSLGVIGEYVGRIYEELKARPTYLVKSTTNITKP